MSELGRDSCFCSGLMKGVRVGRDAVVPPPPLLRGYLTHAFFFFFIVLGANFQGEYSVYPSRTLTRILHYCLEQFGPVCFLSLTLWQPNGPATPQLLSTADIMCF